MRTVEDCPFCLDDCAYDEEEKRRTLFLANMMSLATTQRQLARCYQAWASEGGPRAEQYAKEAQRLQKESERHFNRAIKEQEDLDND